LTVERKTTRIIVLAFSPVVILGLAACGGSALTHSAQTTMTPLAALTDSQGASICNDLNTWLIQAMNEGQPRFTAKMESDQTEAGNTNLGADLETPQLKSSEPERRRSLSIAAGLLSATGLGALQQDCTAYGVNVHQAGAKGEGIDPAAYSVSRRLIHGRQTNVHPAC